MKGPETVAMLTPVVSSVCETNVVGSGASVPDDRALVGEARAEHANGEVGTANHRSRRDRVKADGRRQGPGRGGRFAGTDHQDPAARPVNRAVLDADPHSRPRWAPPDRSPAASCWIRDMTPSVCVCVLRVVLARRPASEVGLVARHVGVATCRLPGRPCACRRR